MTARTGRLFMRAFTHTLFVGLLAVACLHAQTASSALTPDLVKLLREIKSIDTDHSRCRKRMAASFD